MFTSMGDLSRALVLQSRQTSIRNEMDRLTEEMTSGLKSDLAKEYRGDLTQVSALQSDLSRVAAHLLSSTETQLVTDTMQTVLGAIQNTTQIVANDFLKVDLATSAPARDALSNAAGEVFDSIVANLNTSVGGRSLFSGQDTNSAALVSSSDLMSQVKAALLGSVTNTDVETRLDAFFDTPGGDFDTSVYMGNTSGLPPLSLGTGESVELDVRADQSVFREMLKATVGAHLATDPDLALDSDTQAYILRWAGDKLLREQGELTNVRAGVGAIQERISNAITATEEAQSSLRMARNDLAAADQYDTAMELQRVQSQLEALYTVSARNSQISLVNFLR